MQTRRVAVTGTGCVSCIGNSTDEMWKSLLSGKSGISAISKFDTAGFATTIAGEVKDLALEGVSVKEARRMSEQVRFAFASAFEAVGQSGISGNVDPERFGCIFSTATGGLDAYDKAAENLKNRGSSGVSALFIPMYLPSGAAGNLALKFNLQGPGYNVCSACASGTHAIGEAFRMIRYGEADAMLCGGTDACVTPLMLSGFSSLTALSTRNDEPEKASRPFAADRDGFVLADGAAALVLEDMEHAKRRGALILAEVCGYGASCDAYHITAPHPDARGSISAMRRAVSQAGCSVSDIGYISAHGTATRLNDICESRAINALFAGTGVKVSSIKSMTGHAIGAAGAIEAVSCVQSLFHSTLIPTVNCEEQDSEIDLHLTSRHAEKCSIIYALNNSLGFGGHNAALVLKKYSGD